MQSLRSPALWAGALLLAPVFLTGCNCFGLCNPKAAAATAAPKETGSKYERLAAKAEAGDVQSARELAKWCYTHDTDNVRMKYWLEVAARNGDHSSAKVADYVQDWR